MLVSLIGKRSSTVEVAIYNSGILVKFVMIVTYEQTVILSLL